MNFTVISLVDEVKYLISVDEALSGREFWLKEDEFNFLNKIREGSSMLDFQNIGQKTYYSHVTYLVRAKPSMNPLDSNGTHL